MQKLKMYKWNRVKKLIQEMKQLENMSIKYLKFMMTWNLFPTSSYMPPPFSFPLTFTLGDAR